MSARFVVHGKCTINKQTIEQRIEDNDDYEVCIAVLVVIS